MQIGIWSTCWFTAALGVHTLSSLVFHVRPAHWRGSATIAIGWTIAFVAGEKVLVDLVLAYSRRF